MQEDDQTLLQQVVSGIPKVLEMLYARYRLVVGRYIWYRLGRDSSWMEEILQEVFLAVWSSAIYRGEAQFEAWILRIAHYMVLNARRVISRRAEGYLLQDQDDQSEPTLSYEEAAIDRLGATKTKAFLQNFMKHMPTMLDDLQAVVKQPL